MEEQEYTELQKCRRARSSNAEGRGAADMNQQTWSSRLKSIRSDMEEHV